MQFLLMFLYFFVYQAFIFLAPTIICVFIMMILYRLKLKIYGIISLPILCAFATGVYSTVVTAILGYNNYGVVCSLFLSVIIGIFYYIIKEDESEIWNYKRSLVFGLCFILIFGIINFMFFPFSFGDYSANRMGQSYETSQFKSAEKFNNNEDVLDYIAEHYESDSIQQKDITSQMTVTHLFNKQAYIIEFYYHESDIKLYILSDGHIQEVKRTKYV